MKPDDVKDLIVFAMNLWPRTFVVPQNEDELRIMEHVWIKVLSDLDPALIEAAMIRWDDHWPPTPGELRSAALEVSALAKGRPRMPDVDQAWMEFKANYKTRGPWSHPAVAAAAKTLGCKEFGLSETADEMAWRAHFFKLYGAASERIERDSTPMPPALDAYMKNTLKKAPQGELGEGDDE